MKIEIKNFGLIDYFFFDLEKDLHLVYGQNAIGKSYPTFCIYCFLNNTKESGILTTKPPALAKLV